MDPVKRVCTTDCTTITWMIIKGSPCSWLPAGVGGKSGRYGVADVTTSAVPLHDADAVPAAPPDYDQYAQVRFWTDFLAV
jgi:hypothetical protein